MSAPKPTIMGRWTVAEKIGEGRFGTVFRAYDDVSKRDVALKEFTEWRESFRREAAILTGLDHPNLVKVLDLVIDETAGRRYLVEELIHGQDLLSYLCGADWDGRWNVLAQLLRGLDYLHARGVVHLDIKPTNILIELNANREPKAKILDFGVAETMSGEVGLGRLSGTFPYVSPEVVRGERVDGRADLYSLGMVFYQAVQPSGVPVEERSLDEWIHETLRRKAPTPHEFGSDIPSLFGEILERLLQPDPRRRFRTANEVIRYMNRSLGKGFPLEPGRLRLPETSIALLAGRKKEIEILKKQMEGFLAGTHERTVVGVLGEPGMGKSAMLEAVKRWSEAQDIPPVDLTGPGAGLSRFFDAVIRPGDEVRLEKYGPYLKQILPDRFRDAADPEPLGADPRLERVRLHDQFTEVFTRAMDGRTLVVLVDDLGRKAEVREFVSYLFRHPRERRPDRKIGRFALVFSADSDAEVPEGWPVDLRVDLQGWSRDDLRGVVGSLLGVEDVPEHVVRALWEQTEGVPGRVVERLRLLAETALRVGEDVEAQLRTLSGPELQMAGSLPIRTTEQFGRLDGTERLALQWIALSPSELSSNELGGMDPLLGVGLDSALRRLTDQGWIVPVTGGFRMASVLRAQVVAGSLPAETVRVMHKKLAHVLRGRKDVPALNVAGELIRGGEEVNGFQSARVELEALLKLNRSGEVERFLEGHEDLESQLNHTERRVLHRIRARAHLASGRFDHAIRLLERVTAEAGDGEPELMVLLARAYRYGGQLEAAKAALERARSTGPTPAQTIVLDALLADVCLEQGEYRGAADVADDYLTERKICGADDLIAFRHVRAKAHFYLGENEQAISLFRRNCSETEGTGSLARRALSLNSLATAQLAEGQVEESLRLLHAAVELARQVGDLRTLALAQVNLGVAYSEKGEGEAAFRYYEEGLTTFRKIGDQASEARTLYNAGVLRVQAGAWVQAEEAFAGALELAGRLGMKHFESTVRRQRAECALQRGEVDRALGECDQAEALAREAGSSLEIMLARLKRIEVRLSVDAGPAEDFSLVSCEEEISRAPHPEIEAWCLYLRGQITKQTHPEEARQMFEQARLRWKKSATADPSLRLKIDRALSASPSADPKSSLSPMESALQTPAGESPPLDALSILEFARQMNSPVDTSEVLTGIVDALVRFTGADRGFLLLREEGKLVARVARDRRGVESSDAIETFSMTVAEETLKKRSPVITFDAYGDPRFKGSTSVYQLQLRSIVCVPLFVRGEVLGALYLDSRARPGQFGESQIPVLTALSDLAATAIYKAQLIAQNVKGQRDLRKSLEDLKDSHHRVHQLNEELARANEKLKALLEEKEREIETTQHRLEVLIREEEPKYRYDRMIGSSRAWKNVLLMVDRAVDSRVPVLIQGESGTGKELIARAIHFNSPRKDKPFVPVNCAALPPDLFESELFGHMRGAFTGADRDRPGLFEAADGGTLFLDEVGELPLSVQAKLLRVLQDGSVRRLGATKETRVDVRLIAATNRLLEKQVSDRLFREDLYYRLSVFQIFVPPLRDRREDLHPLVEHFLEEMAKEEGKPRKKLSPAGLRRLQRYGWPGNVRELENVLRQAFLFSSRNEIEAAELVIPEGGRAATLQGSASEEVGVQPLRFALHGLRRRLIEQALKSTGGNVSSAARLLEVDRTQLNAWLKRLAIARPGVQK